MANLLPMLISALKSSSLLSLLSWISGQNGVGPVK